MAGILTKGRPAVFNEKLWGLTRLVKDGRDVFDLAGVSPARAREALEAHSWHGPYSRQRVSRLVEESVAAVGGTCEAVVDRPEGEVQPFVATYMDWLEGTHGLSWGEPMPLALFHQASNGGVRCDVDGWTRVPGLYAAGEVAPVFAVDRLGGIASATAMVFGLAAGGTAARSAASQRQGGRRDLCFRGEGGAPQAVSSLEGLSPDGAAALGEALAGRLRTGAHDLVRAAMDEAGSPF